MDLGHHQPQVTATALPSDSRYSSTSSSYLASFTSSESVKPLQKATLDTSKESIQQRQENEKHENETADQVAIEGIAYFSIIAGKGIS